MKTTDLYSNTCQPNRSFQNLTESRTASVFFQTFPSIVYMRWNRRYFDCQHCCYCCLYLTFYPLEKDRNCAKLREAIKREAFTSIKNKKKSFENFGLFGFYTRPSNAPRTRLIQQLELVQIECFRMKKSYIQKNEKLR